MLYPLALAGLTVCQLALAHLFWAQLGCWEDWARETKASFTVLSTTNLSSPPPTNDMQRFSRVLSP
jgi:hypothetical protein